MLAIVLRLTLKKSLAAMPIVVNNRPSQTVMITNATGRALPRVQ